MADTTIVLTEGPKRWLRSESDSISPEEGERQNVTDSRKRNSGQGCVRYEGPETGTGMGCLGTSRKASGADKMSRPELASRRRECRIFVQLLTFLLSEMESCQRAWLTGKTRYFKSVVV